MKIKEIRTGRIITEGIAVDNLNKPALAIGDVFISFKIAVILFGNRAMILPQNFRLFNIFKNCHSF